MPYLGGPIDAAALGPFTATDDITKSLLYFGCDFSGWYNFWKLIKIVATICYILKLKCTKFDFAYSAPLDTTLAGFEGPTSERNGGIGKRGEGKGLRGREGKR